MKVQLKIALVMLLPAVSLAQVPVDEDGNVIAQYESGTDAVLLSQDELQELVGPIALYPDDLLAIVLPASAYPLQVVEAARFIEAYENDSSLEPSPDWDESIVALTNYPEVLALLNNDLDWTLRLGEAVASQQIDVISAVEAFRDRAYAAGNLKTDEYQTVSEDDGVIYISPAEEDAIYVPYYEPEQVVYYQPEPVYYYYPRARPVYYYPYAAGYNFYNNYFWGVSTAFTIGWLSNSLHTHHYSYYGHPYYGHSYGNHWYRRPSIVVYNSYYSHGYQGSGGHHSNGDRWQAHEQRREYVRREGYSRSDRRSDSHNVNNGNTARRDTNRQDIQFRERDTNVTPRGDVARNSNASSTRDRSGTGRNNDATRNSGNDTSRGHSSNRERTNTRDRASTQNSRTAPSLARNSNASAQQTTRQQPAAAQTRDTRSSRRQESQTPRNNEQRVASLRQQLTTTRSQPQAVTQARNTRRQEPARRAPQVAPAQQTRRAEAPRQQRQSQPQPARQQPSRSQSSSHSSGNQSEGRSSQSRSSTSGSSQSGSSQSRSGESRSQSRSQRR